MLDLGKPMAETTLKHPIPVAEHSSVLDLVLRAIYPPPNRLRSPPEFLNPEHAVSVLRALDKYEITAWWLEDAAASTVGKVDPPILAWALAIQANSNAAREIAVRRFLVDASSSVHYHAPGLSSVDGWSVMKLLQLRDMAVTEARSSVEEIISASLSPAHVPTHTHHSAYDTLTSASLRRPFDNQLLSEDILSARISGLDGGCSTCMRRFVDNSSKDQRGRARERLEKILEEAVVKEANRLPETVSVPASAP